MTGLPVPLQEQGMKVRMFCYEGYRAEETPLAFLLGDRRDEWEIQMMESPSSTG